MKETIYLDNNATTRPLPEVIDAMARCFRDGYANPGSRHAAGRRSRRALEDARETIAGILGAEPDEVIFTSGGTESSNLAIFGLTGAVPATIVLTAGEHPATLEPCRQLEQHGWTLHFLDVDGHGRLVADQVDNLPWDELKLVTVILAHNETGVIQDVGALAKLCAARRVPLHLDAVQAVGKIPVDFRASQATTLALAAHKFQGPRGIGALLVRDGVRLQPQFFGGHQESGRRPGTEPVALIVGMAKALELWHADRDARSRRMTELRDRLETGLAAICAPIVVNGAGAPRLPNTSNVAFPGVDGDALLVALDLAGIACSLGSACASGSSEPAPVLLAMGCPDGVVRSSIRFSLSFETTADEIDRAVAGIGSIVSRIRNSMSSKA